jgi:hypothetical protein
MHNMHDLRCLNACVTPGCYRWRHHLLLRCGFARERKRGGEGKEQEEGEELAGGGANWDLLQRRHPFTVGGGHRSRWPRARVCGAERNGQRQNVARVRGRSNDCWFCSA